MFTEIQKFADGIAALTAAGNRLADSRSEMERYGVAIKGNNQAMRDLTQSLTAAVEGTAKFTEGLGGIVGLLGGGNSALAAFSGLRTGTAKGLKGLDTFAKDAANAMRGDIDRTKGSNEKKTFNDFIELSGDDFKAIQSNLDGTKWEL